MTKRGEHTVTDGPLDASPERDRAEGGALPQPSATDASPGKRELSPEQRQRLIEAAAYFRAERRGFAPGYELDDWLMAEAEINAAPWPGKT